MFSHYKYISAASGGHEIYIGDDVYPGEMVGYKIEELPPEGMVFGNLYLSKEKTLTLAVSDARVTEPPATTVSAHGIVSYLEPGKEYTSFKLYTRAYIGGEKKGFYTKVVVKNTRPFLKMIKEREHLLVTGKLKLEYRGEDAREIGAVVFADDASFFFPPKDDGPGSGNLSGAPRATVAQRPKAPAYATKASAPVQRKTVVKTSSAHYEPFDAPF